MKFNTLQLILIFLLFFSTAYSHQKSNLSTSYSSNNELIIAVDPLIHIDYGLSYPLTYQLAIPQGSSGLKAYRKFSTVETWTQIIEKTSSEFFNGIEAVRFDYTNNMAYLSVAFSNMTDSIFLKITGNSNIAVHSDFNSISKYYDNRKAVVIGSADDWQSHFNDDFLMAVQTFREYNLWLTVAIITEKCDYSTWQTIQTQLDLGYVEAAAHGRNHNQVPYSDAAYEITGAKEDIIDNLELPMTFRNGNNEYVYTWIAPYGYYDGEIESLLSLNHYLVNRLYFCDFHFFSDWNYTTRMYEPIGVSREIGPRWFGTTDLTDLNSTFDAVVDDGGVYHLMFHPHVFVLDDQWEQDYFQNHLDYISNKKNIWYTSLGHLYLYHFIQDNPWTMINQTKTPGIKVDNTTADLQTYYNSPSNYIYLDPASKKVYCAYTWSNAPVANGMDLSARFNNLNDGGFADIKTDYSFGNPSIRKGADGRFLISAVSGAIPWIYTNNWVNGVALFRETGVNTGKFELQCWFDENPISGSASILNAWLQVDDNGRIHWLAYDGTGQALLYKNSDDNGSTFCPVVIIGGKQQVPGYTQIQIPYFGNYLDFGAALASNGTGKVAIICSDQGGDVFIIESSDQGTTWPTEPTNITDYGYIGDGDTENPRPDLYVDAIYDNNDELHVVYEGSYWLDGQSVLNERYPWFGNGPDSPYLTDYKSRIQHWCPSSGVTTVAISTSPDYDLIGVHRYLGGREKIALVSQPTIAYDKTNDVLYVGYTQYNEWRYLVTEPVNDPDGEGIARFIGYGDLFLSYSDDGGATWEEPQNITNTRYFDERHIVLNDQVINNKVYMFYVGDENPGYEFFGYLPPVVSGIYYYVVEGRLWSLVDNFEEYIPETFFLKQNYPNPFNPTTTIEYQLPKTSYVELKIFNMAGQEIKTLIANQIQAGYHSVAWDGTNDDNAKIASGIYIYRIEFKYDHKSFIQARKITVLK